MSSRDQNIELLKKYLKKDYMIKHSIAVEAAMEAIAVKFDRDIDLYRTAGLMHDIDYELTEKDPENHAIVGAKILHENGFEEVVCNIVLAHRKSRLAGAWPETVIIAVDTSCHTQCPVSVRTCKTGININLINTCAELFFHKRAE